MLDEDAAEFFLVVSILVLLYCIYVCLRCFDMNEIDNNIGVRGAHYVSDGLKENSTLLLLNIESVVFLFSFFLPIFSDRLLSVLDESGDGFFVRGRGGC